MQGRKPKPSVLANLHGRPSKDKAPTREPRAITGDLADAPAWLSPDQKLAWAYAIEHAPPGMLKRIDRGSLTVWIVAEDLHRQAAIEQSKYTLLIKTPVSGVFMQSPYLPIINRQGLIMLKAASELGFSPVSRVRAMGDQLPEPGLRPSTVEASVDAAHFVPLDDYLEDAPTVPQLN